MLTTLAYVAGQQAAKVAFLSELQEKVRGNVGPLVSSFFTKNPWRAGAAGAGAQLADTPPGESKILQALGVGGGAAVANAIVNPLAKIVATAAVSALGLDPSSGWTKLLHGALTELPTGAAQKFVATKGRDAAKHLDNFLKAKGTRVP